MAKQFKESLLNFGLGALATLALTAIGYAVTTSWQNSDRLAQVSSDMKSIKASLVRLSLKSSPGDPTIPIELLSSKGARAGLELFAAGNYPAAYEAWSAAAHSGDQLSVLAIGAARESLELRLEDHSLPAKERALVEDAIRAAPELEIVDGMYVLKNRE